MGARTRNQKKNSRRVAIALLCVALGVAGSVWLMGGKAASVSDDWAKHCIEDGGLPKLSNKQLEDLNVGVSVRDNWVNVREEANLPAGCSVVGPSARTGHIVYREIFGMEDSDQSYVVVAMEANGDGVDQKYIGYSYMGKDGSYHGGSATPGASLERLAGLNVKQQWDLNPGETIAGFRVSGGLGDVAIETPKIKLSYAGVVVKSEISQSCYHFATPQVPGYVTRLCGVHDPMGQPHRDAWPGETWNTTETLNIALLREQPNGSWAIVEPSQDWLSLFLSEP